ncbi:hypothetical protein RAS2_17060 [Phycisphaerae bacterium RAS2]|nr:hypothetical protein RAS2_17060 [Phycisphaerae bacterium RAS2]
MDTAMATRDNSAAMIVPVAIRKTGGRFEAFAPAFADLKPVRAASMDAALARITESVASHIADLADSGTTVPDVGTVETIAKRPECKRATITVVQVDDKALETDRERVNIIIARRILAAADDYAKRNGLNRSELFTKAVAKFIGFDPRKILRFKWRGRPAKKKGR